MTEFTNNKANTSSTFAHMGCHAQIFRWANSVANGPSFMSFNFRHKDIST